MSKSSPPQPPAAAAAPAHNGTALFREVLQGIWTQFLPERSGEVATYIPELAKVDPDLFGLCIMTMDGTIYEAGASTHEFTIQSISKPFAYGMALEQCGQRMVRSKVGVEPSGEAFNSISLEPQTGRPLNPMINAGAIAVSSLVQRTLGDSAENRMLEWFSKFAARPLAIDPEVHLSESSTGHRNRAIAHLLRNFGIVGDPVEDGLDLYFRQCSMLVNCRDLAALGATLANRGLQPVTGRRALTADYVDHVLSIMTTCGMYNYAGQWLHEVGLPAKSGVAGGICAVLPGRMGIGVFSPRLDGQGNSVRGIAVCREMSRRFRLHLFDVPRSARSVIRAEGTLASRFSTRMRSAAETARLRDLGAQAHWFELQGDLQLAALEVVQRHAWKRTPEGRLFLFDLAHVDSADETAASMFGLLLDRLLALGAQVVTTGLQIDGLLFRHLTERRAPSAAFPTFEDAVEACEDSLLHGVPVTASPGVPGREVAIPGLDVAEALGAKGMRVLESMLEHHEYPRGARIFKKGDADPRVFFVLRGIVSVRLPTSSGASRQLAAFEAGTVFGEMALIDRGPRSSDVWADTDVACVSLSLARYEALGTEHPALKFKLLEYLVRVVAGRLRRANDQIAALAG